MIKIIYRRKIVGMIVKFIKTRYVRAFVSMYLHISNLAETNKKTNGFSDEMHKINPSFNRKVAKNAIGIPEIFTT